LNNGKRALQAGWTANRVSKDMAHVRSATSMKDYHINISCYAEGRSIPQPKYKRVIYEIEA